MQAWEWCDHTNVEKFPILNDTENSHNRSTFHEKVFAIKIDGTVKKKVFQNKSPTFKNYMEKFSYD